MNSVTFFFVLGATLLITGCGPSLVDIETEEPVTNQDSPPEVQDLVPALPAPIESAPVVAERRIEQRTEYVVLNEPWNKYFRSTPKLLVVPKISTGMANLLAEEQRLIKSVLDSGSDANSSSEYVALEDKLEELKAVIPQAETGSGYVPRSSRRYGSYSYISGGTVYTNSRYYSGYYTVLREKTMSSSPEMTRSVEGIAHNATIEDLDQRIDALKQIQRSWNRKTTEMSPNGTSGIMRSANLAYLEGLRDFTAEFTNLRKELRGIKQKQTAIQKNRSNILSDWQTFENSRLELLKDYLNSNATEHVEISGNDIYTLPDFAGKKLLYACEIGERTLYFDLTDKHSKHHPFVLVNVDPIQ